MWKPRATKAVEPGRQVQRRKEASTGLERTAEMTSATSKMVRRSGIRGLKREKDFDENYRRTGSESRG